MITLEFSPNTLYETSDPSKQTKSLRLAVKRLYLSDAESSSKSAKILVPIVPKKAFQDFKAKSEVDGQRITIVGKSRLKQVSSDQIEKQKSGTSKATKNSSKYSRTANSQEQSVMYQSAKITSSKLLHLIPSTLLFLSS